MSNVNAGSEELFRMAGSLQNAYNNMEVLKRSLTLRYQQMGAGWNDRNYDRLGDVIKECTDALRSLMILILQAEKASLLMAKYLREYEQENLNNASAMPYAYSYSADSRGSSAHGALDAAEAESLVMNAGKEWIGSLSSEEISAIRDYTSTAYLNINGVLRGIEKEFAPGYEEKAVNLHRALQSSSIPCTCTVYRGASNAALGPYQNLSDDELVGCVLHDNGFLSTSLQPENAFSNDIRIEISVPEGTHGAYVGYVSSAGHYETEVLLDCGQMMRVTGVTRDLSGNRTIHVSVMQAGNGNHSRGTRTLRRVRRR